LVSKLRAFNIVATAELGQFVDLDRLATTEGFLYRKFFQLEYSMDQVVKHDRK